MNEYPIPLQTAASFDSLALARTPRVIRWIAGVATVLFFLCIPLLMLAPWTQTVHGIGRAVAFHPAQRTQFIVSPIEGRVRKWHVVEGDVVKAGQRLVDLVDNDPRRLERLEEQELLALQRLTLADGRVLDQEGRLRFVRDERDILLAEADARIAQAEAQLIVFQQELERAKADLVREELSFRRMERLFGSKVGEAVSKDQVEEAQRKWELAKAQIPLVDARIQAQRKAIEQATLQKSSTDTRTNALIRSEEAAVKSARSEQASVRQQLNSIATDLERQRNQSVTAPTDGTIFRLLANAEAGGQLVRPGERLAVLVPQIKPVPNTTTNHNQALAALIGCVSFTNILTQVDYPGITVELSIDGNDLPLVRKGDRVLLQFEGWAAVQFASYPNAATGTFEGRVYLVDPTSDDRGRFRLLVEPGLGENWPNDDYLRQGVRAQGWVLAQDVSVGYELWRLLNGFPPAREVKPKEPKLLLGPVERK